MVEFEAAALLESLREGFAHPPPMPTTTRFTFAGHVQHGQRAMVARVLGRSCAIEAELDVPDGGGEGVIGGFGLWIDGKGMLNHTYSFLGAETY